MPSRRLRTVGEIIRCDLPWLVREHETLAGDRATTCGFEEFCEGLRDAAAPTCGVYALLAYSGCLCESCRAAKQLDGFLKGIIHAPILNIKFDCLSNFMLRCRR